MMGERKLVNLINGIKRPVISKGVEEIVGE